jgi:hypothetical protein
MKAILAIRLIYQTKDQDWAVEISLDDNETHRFPIAAGEQANTVIRAFEGSSTAEFDEASGEIVFNYDPVKLDDLLDFRMDEDEQPGPSKDPKKSKHRR